MNRTINGLRKFNQLINTFSQNIALILVLIATTGCAGPRVTYLEIPYKYRSLASVKMPEIAPGEEKVAISRAIICALQEMEYSIEPTIPIGELLPEGQDIITDPVPLRPAVILSHNSKSLLDPIPLNARYRLTYLVQYGIVDKPFLTHKHFSLMIWSILERRGAGGKWHAYPKSYSTRFFACRLRDRIEEKLK